MTKELHGLCQSGQAVEVAGTYEVVGVQRVVRTNDREKTRDTFHAGEFFPDYEGRAVCWYLIETIADEDGIPQPITLPRHDSIQIN
jgi:hypothetical protein